MPLAEGFMGTNADGLENEEYCVICFKDGVFTEPDLTMEEMIAKSVEHMTTVLQMPEEEAKRLAQTFIPPLKRWSA